MTPFPFGWVFLNPDDGFSDQYGVERSNWEASQLEERIDRIVTLAVTYPEATDRVARRFLAEEGRLASLSLVCESVGIEYARVLFNSLPDYAWQLIEAPLRAPIPLERALEAFSRELLAECMEEPDAADSEENPFDFITKARTERLAAVFRGYSIERIALLATYLSRAEMARIAGVLPPEAAKRLVMTVARLHRLPRSVTKAQARDFADEIRDAFEFEETKTMEIQTVKIEPTGIRPAISPLDWAISEIDLDRELELLAEARGESQEIDEILKTMPSSESIRAIVESARQKISG